jgi:hypothetical protein
MFTHTHKMIDNKNLIAARNFIEKFFFKAIYKVACTKTMQAGQNAGLFFNQLIAKSYQNDTKQTPIDFSSYYFCSSDKSTRRKLLAKRLWTWRFPHSRRSGVI